MSDLLFDGDGGDVRGVELENGSELLFRQVPYVQSKAGQPASPAFRPSSKDRGAMSTRREWIGPRRAFEEYNASPGCRSIGTYALSVDELRAFELRAFDDSHFRGYPDGHASVHFPNLTGAELKRLSQRLKSLAIARGCQYPLVPVFE